MSETVMRDQSCPPPLEHEPETRLPSSRLSSLDEARSVPDGVVILMRAQRATIYATCPGSLVHCEITALEQLTADLDVLVWPELPAGGLISFEQWPVRARLAGAMGGGRIAPGVWVHSRLVEMGLEHRTRAVLDGRSERLIGPPERAYAVARIDEDRMRHATQNRLCRDAFPYPLPLEVMRIMDTFEAAQVEVDRLNACTRERSVYFMTWGPLILPP